MLHIGAVWKKEKREPGCVLRLDCILENCSLKMKDRAISPGLPSPFPSPAAAVHGPVDLAVKKNFQIQISSLSRVALYRETQQQQQPVEPHDAILVPVHVLGLCQFSPRGLPCLPCLHGHCVHYVRYAHGDGHRGQHGRIVPGLGQIDPVPVPGLCLCLCQSVLDGLRFCGMTCPVRRSWKKKEDSVMVVV
ncbi:hypothetical protein BGZ47_009249 [Haplosporangium gracile]|nr:hypothetical protein BGZ47_009249 [Haplosporangium gracile]